ncbi:hypothetical protein ADUPG1_001846, partial [Aduncisulcus paluster]
VVSHTRNPRGKSSEKDKYRFTVKWLGYEETTVEPWSNLEGSTQFVEYCKRDKKLKEIFLTKSRKNGGNGKRKRKDWQREDSESSEETSDEDYKE